MNDPIWFWWVKKFPFGGGLTKIPFKECLIGVTWFFYQLGYHLVFCL